MKFIIKMRTAAQYHDYMMGGNGDGYSIIEVEAISKYEAMTKAEKAYPNMVICEHMVKTLAEVEREREEREKSIREYREERERQALKKHLKEIEKANSKGLTLEEYKEAKRIEANYKRHLTAIKKATEEIARLEKEIKYHIKRAEEYKAQL